MNQRALFIGGPIDGQWLDDPGLSEFTLQLRPVWSAGGVSGDSFALDPIQTFTYDCQRLVVGGLDVPIYYPKDWTTEQAFMHLLRGYKKS